MELDAMNDEQLLSEAMKQGYNPDYDGDNKKTPREFLDVAFTHNKVLRDRNEKLSETNEDLSLQVQNLNDQMRRLVEFQEQQKQRAVDKAIAKLKEERVDAISNGDVELVQKIDDQIEEEKNVAKSNNNPILDAWMSKNPWYVRDDELGLEADIIAKQLQDTGRFAANPQDYQKLLDTVERKIKKQYPDKFKNPKKDNPPDVEPARQSSANDSKKTYADLPADAKKACDQFVNDKIMTREQYLEIYEWE